jgi:spore maturation protein CgeB
MTTPRWKWVVAGLSITSSWGNGHATTYRGLLRELAVRGHDVTFLECDVPWYASHRDTQGVPGVRIELYQGLDDGLRRHARLMREADVVIVGSYVPDGVRLVDWVLANARGVTAFYDIDTPVTLAALQTTGGCEYVKRTQVAGFDLYLSFAGGRAIERLADLGARQPVPLYCSVDPRAHRPALTGVAWDLGYLGTYAADRQPALESLMLAVARAAPSRRFVVAGPMYPSDIAWPANVARLEHVPPSRHAAFYLSQRFTLNLTRADMRAIGHAPSVRLFEAAGCGAAIISDTWDGIDEFLSPGREILLAQTRTDVERYLREVTEEERIHLGRRAQKRVLGAHTSAHRAMELEAHVASLLGSVVPADRSRSRLRAAHHRVRDRRAAADTSMPDALGAAR